MTETNQNKTSVDEATYNHPVDTEIVEDMCNEHTIFPDAPTILSIEEAQEALEHMQAHVHEHLRETLEDNEIMYEDNDVFIINHNYWITYEDAKFAGLEENGACHAIVHMHNQAAKEYLGRPSLNSSHAYVVEKTEKVVEQRQEFEA